VQIQDRGEEGGVSIPLAGDKKSPDREAIGTLILCRSFRP